MALIVRDRVRDTTTTTGTGTITLSGTAPLRYRNFSSVLTTSDTFPYAIVHQGVGVDEWEVGIGTLASSTTFTRTTILAGTNGASAVVFSAGTKDVMLVDAAMTLPFRTITGTANRIVVTNGSGSAGNPVIDLDPEFAAITFMPTGRLTLTSGRSVLTANTTAQSTIYYTSHPSTAGVSANTTQGPSLPSFDGTNTRMIDCGGEQSFILDATNHLNANLYDVFWDDAGARLVTGPAWTNSTTRSAALAFKNDWLTNAASMTGRISNNGGTTTIAINRGFYLGTVRTTANAQTGMNFLPTAAAGGNNSVLGVFNAYNRVPMMVVSRDSTASWTYGTSTWRAANGNANNAVNFVDGLGDTLVYATYIVTTQGSSGQASTVIGINLNSTSATPGLQGVFEGSTSIAGMAMASGIILPSLGYNTINAVENSNGTQTFIAYGSGYSNGAGQTQGLTAIVSI